MVAHLLAVVRYVVSGGTAAVVNIGGLYLFTEYAHFHYLQSAVLAFLCAFCVSFTLQKFWTFRNASIESVHVQMGAYVMVSIANLLLNTTLLALFVEIFHVWYVVGAILSSGTLAVITFFVYRHLVFSAKANTHMQALVSRVNVPTALFLFVLLLTLVLATHKLTESPPTWLDEGIITQVAHNMLSVGPHAMLQVAPEQYVSAGYVTTAYTVTAPIAVAFSLFDYGLWQARAVMVLYLLVCVAMAYAVLRSHSTTMSMLSGVLLLATFAPLYGNGKNVLGEVPGLFYTLAFLWFVYRIEKQALPRDFFLAGVMLGLAVATKPIFILLLPAAGVVLFFSRALITAQKLLLATVGFVGPMVLWVATQFKEETIGQMLAIYLNPHSNDIGASVVANMVGFFTRPEPLYAAAVLGVWLISLGVRVARSETIPRAEWIAALFAIFVYLAYVRGASYYRYFFLGEILALMYLPGALVYLSERIRLPHVRKIALTALGCLVLLQLYQVCFDSWVADHYKSQRTAALAALRDIPKDSSILLYQAPEAAVFLPTPQYYQYLRITKTITVGQENIESLRMGVPDAVVILQEEASRAPLERYRQVGVFDRYSLWYKI